MLSLVFDTGFFIDVLTYVLNSKDGELGKQIVNIFYAEKNENPGLNSPVNKVCINIINEIVNEQIDIKNEGQLASLELKIRESRAVKKDPKVFESLRRILLSPTLDTTKINTIRKTISDKLKWFRSFKPIKRMTEKSQTYIASSDEAVKQMALTDIEKCAYDLLKGFETPLSDKRYLEYIRTDNIKQIERAFELHNQRTEDALFITGQQGLNRLLGSRGGMSSGQLLGICAQSSHHKTGTLLNIVRWTCTLNSPWTEGRIGKPSVVLISLEEDINTSINDLYYALYSNATGETPINKPISEMAKYIFEEFSKRGFTLHLFRETSGEFSINDYRQRLTDLMDQGFDPQLVAIDYFGLMKFDESGGEGNRAQVVKATAEKVKSFGKRHSFITALGLQANEAVVRELTGKGINPVKRYTQSVFQDAKAIYDSLDILIFQHIEENHMKKRFLTYGFGKYRGFKPTISFQRFVAYPFQPFGIPDDIYGQDRSTHDIFEDNGHDSDSYSNESINLFD